MTWNRYLHYLCSFFVSGCRDNNKEALTIDKLASASEDVAVRTAIKKLQNTQSDDK